MLSSGDVAVSGTSSPTKLSSKVTPIVDTPEPIVIVHNLDKLEDLEKAKNRAASDDALPEDDEVAEITWSGKLLGPKESRQFFEMLNKDQKDGVDIAKELPENFIVSSSKSTEFIHRPSSP